VFSLRQFRRVPYRIVLGFNSVAFGSLRLSVVRVFETDGELI